MHLNDALGYGEPQAGAALRAADAVNRLVKTIGVRAKLSFGVHAHMLRHACGYALANAGHDTRLIQDWLGHRAIQHTARYTELSAMRFKDVWR
jgi:site-specific recombinase XerD